MTAKTISIRSLVKLADKRQKPQPEPSYEFTGRTFHKKPKPPGKHIRNE